MLNKQQRMKLRRRRFFRIDKNWVNIWANYKSVISSLINAHYCKCKLLVRRAFCIDAMFHFFTKIYASIRINHYRKVIELPVIFINVPQSEAFRRRSSLFYWNFRR